MSTFTTSIGEIKDDSYQLRGTPIAELIRNADFISTIWLAWMNAVPTDAVRALLNACLVACIDHGTEPPSANVTRITASCGKPIADAVAAGLLTLGPRHGNAAGASSAWIREALTSGRSAAAIATESIENKKRIPGFGHPEYDVDPRTGALATIATAQLGATPHLTLALEISAALTAQKEKPLPLNVDGAIGAIVADLGAPADIADAIFIASRTIGLLAHAREEAGSGALRYQRG